MQHDENVNICKEKNFISVQCSCSVMSNSLQPQEPQHARPSCPSPTARVYPNPCPLSRWCHPTFSSSVIPFSSCPQSFPASGSLQMSQLFASGGQSIGVSNSTSVLPMNTQDWPPLGWTGWLFLQSKGLKSLLQHHSSKSSILQWSAFFIVWHSNPYITTGKTIASTTWTYAEKTMSLLVIMLSRLVITFLLRSKCVSVSWLQSSSSETLEPPKVVSHCFPCFTIYLRWSDAVFWMLSFKPTFSLSSFTFIKRLFSSFSLSAIRVVSSAYLRLLIFLLAILIHVCASSSPPFLTMYSA